MADERVLEDIITWFFINTCRRRRRRPELSQPVAEAAVSCLYIASTHTVPTVPLTTGSVAEFYIEPMLPHVGDVDVMHYDTNVLAVPRGHTPPTRYPDEFFDVNLFEIVNSHLPGYVYLHPIHCVRCALEGGECDIWNCESNYLFGSDENYRPIHGPALLLPRNETLPGALSTDLVPCVRCLEWPPQAAGWPTRHRKYGWPNSVTVGRVVSNGCDVVRAVHRQCKQHKVIGKRQWRLSFSRAEIVLINSWMPEQQIVYHMLRVFMKTERLTDSADNSPSRTLSNYHIKTLMLWTCELKSRRLWTDHINLVRMCVELMHDLAVWLTEARCPHYFIDNCNLVDSSIDLETIQNGLMSVTKPWLSSWFVNNYIRKCSQLCPQNVSQLFDNFSTTTELQNAVSAIVRYRRKDIGTVRYRWKALYNSICHIMSIVHLHSLKAWSLFQWFNEQRKISPTLHVYFLSIAFLHVACRTSRDGLNDKLMDVLGLLVGQPFRPHRYYRLRSSVLLVRKATYLMEDITDTSTPPSTVQLIVIELSKAYLYRALNCEDCPTRVYIYCLANVYLAVLYYITGQYQTAIDHCTLVTKSEDHSQCTMHVVQGDSLPNIDDNIDTVLGLAVLYQHLRTAALDEQRAHVTVFTTELFAHYLHMKCLSVMNCQQLSDTTNSQSSTCEVRSFVRYISDMRKMFITDAVLWKLLYSNAENKFVHEQQFGKRRYPTECPREPNTSHLVELLQTSAVEHLTTFRQLEARDFGSVVTSVTTDFDALYSYKRGDYQRCLELLYAENVQTLLCAARVPDYVSLPEFIQLLDDDIVSLIALTLIVNPHCRLVDYGYYCFSQLTLSLYLMTQCQLKLHHPVTSLAQTLEYIKIAGGRVRDDSTLDRLVLKMTAQKALTYLNKNQMRRHEDIAKPAAIRSTGAYLIHVFNCRRTGGDEIWFPTS